MMNIIVESDRLLMREMNRSDTDFVASLLADPEVMRYFPRCYSRKEAVAWIDRQLQRYRIDGHGYWLALHRLSGLPVGQVGVLSADVEGTCQSALGYIIDRKCWNLGYATEAASACLNYSLKTLGKNKVITLIRPENGPSQRVAVKIGMKESGMTLFSGYPHLIFESAPLSDRLNS